MKLFLKLLLEFAPLAIFFVVSKEFDIYVGSLILAIATLITMVIMWVSYRRIAMMALITAVTSIGAGSVTYFLTDPMYVMMKPTIVSLVFAVILGAGLLFGKPLLQPLLGEDLHITKRGWMIITWRWTAYFLFIAVLNEVLWRNFSQDFWLSFKVFGLLPMTVLYGILQIPLLARHREPGMVVSHGAVLDKILGWFEEKPKADAIGTMPGATKPAATEAAGSVDTASLRGQAGR
jgi:intracellular septation protein